MSELADQISEAIDATTNHAEVIDRVIQENARTVCSFCGEFTYRGYVADESGWTPEARKAMVDHAKLCEG